MIATETGPDRVVSASVRLPATRCRLLRAILIEVTTAVSAYLADEHDRGRIAAGADLDPLTLSLAGGGHLLFADRDPDRRRRPPSTSW